MFARKDWWKVAALAGLAAWYGFFLLHRTDITQGDLGRHLMNGKIFVSDLAAGDYDQVRQLLTTNFYSSTHPGFPFVNHHWASGLIFYGVWSLAGFGGLTVFFAVVSLAALGLFFDMARRQAPWWLAIALTFALTPLVAERTQARPEMFSYLCAALFLWLLAAYRDGRIGFRLMAMALPLIQIFWVNTHIYFFLGPVFIAIFIASEFLTGRDWGKIKRLGVLLAAVALASLGNPFGVQGAFYPVRIFGNYAFAVQENQGVREFSRVFPWYPNLLIFKAAAVIWLLALAVIFFKKRKQFPWDEAALGFMGMAMGWVAVRNLGFFGFLAVAFLPAALVRALPRNWPRQRAATVVAAALIILTLGHNYGRLGVAAKNFGLGLLPGSAGAGEFMAAHRLAGPLFNDFNVGGYATWYLFPEVRPFVDNRPEAYPRDFFETIYLPAQHDEEAWKKIDTRFSFNSILYSFSNSDSLPFIVNRLQDPAWAPVYADKYSIVFLRRAKANQALIAQYEMSKDRFQLVQ